MACFLIPLTLSSAEYKILLLMKSILSIISFMDYDFGVISKKSLPNSKSPRFFLCYLLGVLFLCICHLGLFEFELIWVWVSSCEDLRICVLIRFFACGCPVVLIPFVEKTLAPLYYLCFFVKDRFTIFMRVYFWALFNVPLMYFSVLSPVPHRLDCCSLIVSLEVRTISPLALFFFSIAWLFWIFYLSL